MRTALAILVPFVALSLAGCSDRLNPGTEMMLTREGATMLHVQNMEKGHRPDQVSEGTKVRVAKQGNPGRVDLGGCPPKSPTDPGLHITRTRFLIS